MGSTSSLHRRFVKKFILPPLGWWPLAFFIQADVTPGWNRKLSYCVAFSIDGATDVTRRYVRNPVKHANHRTRAPEEVLLWVIDEIRRMRREKLPKVDQKRLKKEDEREERELRGYTVSALVAEMNKLLPQRNSSGRPDVKTPTSRDEEAANSLRARQGESNRSDPDPSRDGS